MVAWDDYPIDYRAAEVQMILSAARAGECALVVGLSGAGKSNLLGFLAARAAEGLPVALVDCNRLAEPAPDGLWRELLRVLGEETGVLDPLAALEAVLARRLSGGDPLILLFDRYDSLPPTIEGNLRALRDQFKYRLVMVIAARRPPEPGGEMAELFFGHTLWLGPLASADARWSALAYARRCGLEWPEAVVTRLVDISRGYPSLLRAACQAFADGAALEIAALRAHPAVQRRAAELRASAGAEDLLRSGLEGHPLLQTAPDEENILTAGENRLLQYLRAHAGQVCEKDDLIRAVWSEDRIFQQGLRDDSLAQLVRRLRRKIEPDPDNPTRILTVAGRGYRLLK